MTHMEKAHCLHKRRMHNDISVETIYRRALAATESQENLTAKSERQNEENHR